jgi:RNA polymerase sigma-70 factor (ECF subfamily)
MPAQSQLLQAAQAGDGEAFDALLEPLLLPAYRLAQAMLGDRQQAEDAVQDAAFKAWRKLSNVRPGSDLRPWFLAVVANRCRTLLRSRWWSVVKLASPVAVVDLPLERLASHTELRAQIARLPDSLRLALVLYYFLDLPIDEVGRVLGISPGAAKLRVHRAIARLRPALRAEEVACP